MTAVFAVSAKAAKTDLSTYPTVIYVQDATLQNNADGVIKVCAKSPNDMKGYQFDLLLPAGIEAISEGTTDLAGYGVSANLAITPYKYMVVSTGGSTTDAGDVVIAEIPVRVGDIALGEYEVKVTYQKVGPVVGATVEITDEITSVLTVQRAAVISPIDENNDLQMSPFVLTKGIEFDDENLVTFPFQVKSDEYVRALDFDIKLPAGIEIANFEDEGDIICAEPELLGSLKGAPSVEIASTGANTYHFSMSGGTTKYVNASASFKDFANMAFITSAGLADGVYTMELTNLSIRTKSTTYEGDKYLVSIFVGKPAGDPVVYGYISDDAVAEIAPATVNLTSVDMTSASIDNEANVKAALKNVLAYLPTGTSYTRNASSSYGTIVMPFALTSNSDVQYYTISDAKSGSLTLSEVSSVAANTPAIFKKANETFSVAEAGYIVVNESDLVDGASAGGTTLKGTYAGTSIASGAGYYISGDKFWSDGANIKPFRAYLEGMVAGSARLQIFIEGADGLQNITDELTDEDIYNLSGIRMAKAQKGINIINGKKIVK